MSKEQLHRRHSAEQVAAILEKYESGEISGKECQEYLELKRTQFYEIVKRYEGDPSAFSLEYVRTSPSRRVNPELEAHLLKELKVEKEIIIDNPHVPTKRYNYSYVRNLLSEKHGETMALSTIIKRAKEHGYFKEKPPRKVHDRVVLTNYVGELVQHDSSHHLFAPDAKVKWYLITSLDDFSRALLYADLWEQETTWAHIKAFQDLVLLYGIPFSFYVDQHSIFRYVKDRDKESMWVKYTKFTDDVDPQWKQVLKSVGTKVIYALSPNAKGKIERPYQWLQDHLVRTCVREGVTDITQAREILKKEVDAYNTKRVHSTTGEVPLVRYRNAVLEERLLFRPFKVEPPNESVADIFCLRDFRIVDGYGQVSLGGATLKYRMCHRERRSSFGSYPIF